MNKLGRKFCILGRVFIVVVFLLLCTKAVELNTSSNAATSYPYLIKVNKQQNCITVYKKDKKGKYTVPYKAMVCSTGYATPLGTYKTPAKYRWKVLLDNVWGQYSTRITGGILFHSVWYYRQDPSTLSAIQYNKLGTTCSHGCVRITVGDAKWIYDHCPVGTTVVIYNSKDPGPLGKPKAIKLKANTGWDPTDTYSKANPFNKKTPSITGAVNRTIKYGQKVNVLSGVKAKNTTGYDITSKIKVVGSVNTKKAGKYKITYSVTDEIERKISKSVIFTVLTEEGGKPSNVIDVPEKVDDIEITGVKDRFIAKGTEVDREVALQGITLLINGKKADNKNLNVKIVLENDKKKVYHITYSIAVEGLGRVSKQCSITVDEKAPELKGIVDKKIPWDTTVDKEYALQDITVTDDSGELSTKDIEVRIVKKIDRYIICYSVEDSVGHMTRQYANFVVQDYLRLTGVGDKQVPVSSKFDEKYVLDGIKAYCYEKDITDTIEVDLKKINEYLPNGEESGICSYEVTYTIRDEKNNSYQEKAYFTNVINENSY